MSERDFDQRVLDALETALNGLIWYQINCPEEVQECDYEAVQEIESVIEVLKERLE